MDYSLLFDLGTLFLGIILLVVSGNYLVKGGVGLAAYFKISTLVIGLTVVAFGTSAPELIVSCDAALTGHPEIAIGNVIGSNIANIALVLALTVIILPMPVAEQTIKRSWPFMMFSGIALYLAMLNGVIGHLEGIIMFLFLILFITGSIRTSKKQSQKTDQVYPNPSKPVWIYIIMVVISSVGLAFGSRLLVKGASSVAIEAGVSERIISLTLVAFGTSLPELTASIIAALKRESDLSVGNIIGSNIFNVFAVIGITSGIHNINFRFIDFRVDLYFMIIFYLTLFLFIIPFRDLFRRDRTEKNSLLKRVKHIKGGKISRTAGIVLAGLYVLYLVAIF